MKKNVGNTDKIIRVILAIVLGGLYFTKTVTGGLGIGLLVAGGVLLATTFVSFCPIYAIFGMRSCPVDIKK